MPLYKKSIQKETSEHLQQKKVQLSILGQEIYCKMLYLSVKTIFRRLFFIRNPLLYTLFPLTKFRMCHYKYRICLGTEHNILQGFFLIHNET